MSSPRAGGFAPWMTLADVGRLSLERRRELAEATGLLVRWVRGRLHLTSRVVRGLKKGPRP